MKNILTSDEVIGAPKITRVEVIDSEGRAFVEYFEAGPGVTIELQDDGKTLKIFGGKRNLYRG